MIRVNMFISIQDWLRNHIHNSLSSQDPKPVSQWIDGDLPQEGWGWVIQQTAKICYFPFWELLSHIVWLLTDVETIIVVNPVIMNVMNRFYHIIWQINWVPEEEINAQGGLNNSQLEIGHFKLYMDKWNYKSNIDSLLPPSMNLQLWLCYHGI